MKAQNLAVCVPNEGCNKNCPYCVSRMTGSVKTDWPRMMSNYHKVVDIAERAGISSVLFTGKGEPFYPSTYGKLLELIRTFDRFPCEVQTNGFTLSGWANKCEEDEFLRMSRAGLDIIAFSIDKLEHFTHLKQTFRMVNNYGMLVRVTLNVTDMLPSDLRWTHLVDLCKEHGVRQISLRNITIPTGVDHDSKEAIWIRKHGAAHLFNDLIRRVTSYPRWEKSEACEMPRRIRHLPYGAAVYDCEGIAIAAFDYCVQDEHGDDDMRSLIFQEDGHLYTAWNSPASVLF